MNEVIANDKVHEECGVFGIYSLKGESVSKDIYYGLEALLITRPQIQKLSRMRLSKRELTRRILKLLLQMRFKR